jgi:hypothetical protein
MDVDKIVDRLIDLGLPEDSRTDAAGFVGRLVEVVGLEQLEAGLAREADWEAARGIVGRLVDDGLVPADRRGDAIVAAVGHLAAAWIDDQPDADQLRSPEDEMSPNHDPRS